MQVTPITTTGESFTITLDRSELWTAVHALMELSDYYTRKDLLALKELAETMAQTARTQLGLTYEAYTGEIDRQITSVTR